MNQPFASLLSLKRKSVAVCLTMLCIACMPSTVFAGPCFVKDQAPVKQNPDAPVQIKGYYATLTRNALDVEFVNVSLKTVKDIVWEVRVGNGAAFIRDEGTFAPDVPVSHCALGYGLHGGTYLWRDQAGIRVVRVVFADGSEWATPDAPPEETDF